MAQRQYDVAKGGGKVSVVEAGGSSISTSAVRITVDDGNVGTGVAGGGKSEVIRCIDVIRQRIIEDSWPPA